jgi:DNA (cytosine-5)-methyltransferase 1
VKIYKKNEIINLFHFYKLIKMEFIEICSGAGGLSLGFIKSGFKAVLLNDNNKYCIETLKKNHKDIKIINKCMTELELKEYRNIDIIIGGVPCQSFSQIGKRKGLEDKRGFNS